MNSKFNIIFVLAISLGLVMTSCEGYLEDQVASPNSPTEVTPPLLLSSAELATFATYSGQLVRQSCTFNQQLAGTDAGSQSIEIANYNITEATNTNEWEAIYSGAVSDCQTIIENYGAENPHYRGIARVLMALNLGLASDLWGDVPFSEAGLANITNNFNPVYETQESIVSTGIPNLLDNAIADLSLPASANSFFPGSDDLIYGGNIEAWIKAAYVVKARYANRLSEVNPSGSATDALQAISNGFVDSSEDAFMTFPGGATGQNQWFAFESNRGGYYRVNQTFTDMLAAGADPREPFFLALDENGAYSGTPFDNTSDFSTSYVGPVYAGETSPLPLITYVEQKFIEAEAEMRAGSASNAATAHNEAVLASVLQITGAPAPTDFETAAASETAASITMEKIMTQKYIALFAQIETYSDWRRSGFPNISSNPNAATSIPLRLPTVRDERLYNSNVVVVSDVTLPVYWDQ